MFVSVVVPAAVAVVVNPIKFVIALFDESAPVPPLAIATIPVTFDAVPDVF